MYCDDPNCNCDCSQIDTSDALSVTTVQSKCEERLGILRIRNVIVCCCKVAPFSDNPENQGCEIFYKPKIS